MTQNLPVFTAFLLPNMAIYGKKKRDRFDIFAKHKYNTIPGFDIKQEIL